MSKWDRPRLSRFQWQFIIIDEGHRLKNANCKLNRELKMYKSKSRLLLTGRSDSDGVARCEARQIAPAAAPADSIG